MREALPVFLEVGHRRPPPLVILVPHDASQAADWLNKIKERTGLGQVKLLLMVVGG